MTCHFCHRAIPLDPVPRGTFQVQDARGVWRAAEACSSCLGAWDDRDEDLAPAGRGEPLDPEQLAAIDYLRSATRLPPRRAEAPRCATDGCPNPPRRAGLCWTCTKDAQRARAASRRSAA